jgi:hypothetical protein
MPGSKKSKSAGKSQHSKKPSNKRLPARGAAKTSVKRTKPASAKREVAKSPRAKSTPTVSSPTQLSTAALAREPERKPVKKAEPRPNRPPAVLPIPQSTFFF